MVYEFDNVNLTVTFNEPLYEALVNVTSDVSSLCFKSGNAIILRGGYWETTQKGKFWRKPGYIGFRSANAHHRVDLKEGTKPMTIFIPGPFGLRKGSRSEYGIDFKTKK